MSAGMEQHDLCDATGISMTSISNVETGKVTPRKTTLMLWALATGVSYEWLATGKDHEDNDSGRVTSR
jgi:transcriptional regulator with XRE-family HTH domain